MGEEQQDFLQKTHRQVITAPDNAFGVVVAMTSRGLKISTDRFEAAVAAVDPDLRALWRDPIDDVEAARRVVLHNAGVNGKTHKWVKLPDAVTGNLRSSTRWGLLATTPEGDEAKGEHVGRLSLDTSGPAAVFDASDLPTDAMKAEVTRAFAMYRTNFLTPDVTEGFAKACAKANAVQWGGHGHLYFVPPESLPLVQKAVDIVRDACGRSGVAWWFPCLRDDESHVEVAREAIQDDLEATITQVEQWVRARDDAERGPSARGLTARLDEVVAARDKLDLYQGLLTFKADALQQRIADLNVLLPILIRCAG